MTEIIGCTGISRSVCVASTTSAEQITQVSYVSKWD